MPTRKRRNCWPAVSPRDIGLIRAGQPARLQIDAFPYTQWGLLDARVEQIAADASGKSTLLSLLQRLYTPSGGRIFMGGHDIQYYSLASVRRAVAVAPQQTVLLSGTVVENIAPGDF